MSDGGLERRLFVRLPMDLEAQIAFGEQPPMPCHVKDFCIAGVFVQMDALQLQHVAPQTMARLIFELDDNEASQTYHLDLVVCRRTAHGLGASFQDPDPAVITLLQGRAQPEPLDPIPQTPLALADTQRRFVPEFTARILPLFSAAIERAAALLVNEFTRTVANALFVAARDAGFNREQRMLVDAQNVLRAQSAALAAGFPGLLTRGIAMLDDPLRVKDRNETASDAELSLIDKNDFEEFLTVSEVAAELESQCRAALYDLNKRLSFLARREIDNTNNPIGPMVVCNIFAELLQDFFDDFSVIDIAYQSLRKLLEQHLPRLYEEINTLLVQHNILPIVEPEKFDIKKSTSTARRGAGEPAHADRYANTGPPGAFANTWTQQSWDPAALGGPGIGMGGEAPFGGGMGGAPPRPELRRAMSAAQSQLALRRQLVPAATTAPPAYSTAQVVDGLRDLRTQMTGVAAPDLMPADVIKAQISETLRTHGQDSMAVGQAESDAIDIVVGLFQSLLSDTRVGEFAKGNLRRLQGPVHQAAIVDPTFFESEQHPLRQLIDRVAVTESLPDGEGLHLEARLREMTDDVNLSYDGEPAVVAPLVAELDGYLERQRTVFEQNIRAIVGGAEAQQNIVRERRERRNEARPAEPKFPDELQRWVARAKALQPGDVVVMNANTAAPYTVTLAWIGDDFNPFIFADAQGQKSVSMTLQQVAVYLRRGLIQILPHDEQNAVDRAIFGVVTGFHEEIVMRAARDPLTGLLTRAAFAQAVDTWFEEAPQDATGAVLCELAVDNLKAVNEQFGTATGDELIRTVSQELVATFGVVKVKIGRLGGGEWGIFWTEGGLESTLRQVQALVAKIQEQQLAVGLEFEPRAMAGIAVADISLQQAEALINAAHEATGIARTQGVDPVYVAGSDTKKRQQLEQIRAYVDKAVTRQRLSLLCHEMRPMNKRTAPVARVLVSAKDRNGKLLPWDLFAQASRGSPHSYDMDLWTLRETLRWVATHDADCQKFSGFVIPLSPAALEATDLADKVINELMETSVPPARICFELDDKAAKARLAEAGNFINTLREFGCRFALGEFGAGQGDFEYLRELAVDFVGLPGNYTTDARHDPNVLAVAKSINELAHFMGKQTIASTHGDAGASGLLSEMKVDFIHDTSRTTRLALESRDRNT